MAFMDYILWAIGLLMIVTLARIFIGPSRWDRLLGLSLFSSKIIAIIIVAAYATDTAYLLDLAIVYALFGFLSEIFIALFLADRASDKGREYK